jgi:uncharacterized protein YqgC (DUF456 family)
MINCAMNIFELLSFVAIPVCAYAAYHFASPYGNMLGIAAAIAGAIAGFFLSPLIGMLFLLPFEGAARLRRFLTTGRWSDPGETPSTPSSDEESQGGGK